MATAGFPLRVLRAIGTAAHLTSAWNSTIHPNAITPKSCELIHVVGGPTGGIIRTASIKIATVMVARTADNSFAQSRRAVTHLPDRAVVYPRKEHQRRDCARQRKSHVG